MRRIMISVVCAVLLASVMFAFGQGGTTAAEPGLIISVSGASCELTLADASSDAEATPEATTEAEATPEPTPGYPVLTLGDNCFEVTPRLYVASNDRLWVALALPNEPDWQTFEALPDDDTPPQFDKRGRFVGCAIPLQGEQICRLLWQNIDITYQIEIPITVGKAYTAPVVTEAPAISTPPPPPISTPNSGVWGECGSCTTCGGPVEHCVLSPDNQCLWDARRCENPMHPDPSGG